MYIVHVHVHVHVVHACLAHDAHAHNQKPHCVVEELIALDISTVASYICDDMVVYDAGALYGLQSVLK